MQVVSAPPILEGADVDMKGLLNAFYSAKYREFMTYLGKGLGFGVYMHHSKLRGTSWTPQAAELTKRSIQINDSKYKIMNTNR